MTTGLIMRVNVRITTSSMNPGLFMMTRDLIFCIFLAEALVASVTYAWTTFGCVCVFSVSGVFVHSRVTGARPVTTNLIIMRVKR